MTFTDRPAIQKPSPTNTGWGSVDWEALYEQEKNTDSPFSHIKRMFSLRAKNKELVIGNMEEVGTNHSED